MSTQRPFSKLKKRIEALFVPGLDMRVDCFVHAHRTQYSEVRVPRFTVKLDGEAVWHFPGGFPIKSETPHLWPEMLDVSGLLRTYLDTPVEELTTRTYPGEEVDFQYAIGEQVRTPRYRFNLGLTPLLIAADRRIGKGRLREWAETLPAEQAAHKVLAAREAVRVVAH